MKRIPLPYRDEYACKVCCNISLFPKVIKQCEEIPMREKAGVAIGDLVYLYEYTWLGGSSMGLTPPSPWRVVDLKYSKPGFVLHDRCVDTHTLCAVIRETDSNGAGREKVMTYGEFCLWREGDRKKLEEAGLIEPEKPPKKHSWWKFWERKEMP